MGGFLPSLRGRDPLLNGIKRVLLHICVELGLT
jgi:hypothetical protein